MYEFGKFRCDPQEHRLLREDEPVQLSPKCFEILVVLIQGNGRLLTKDELMQKVWPNSFVEEANLTVNISSLRKALGDSAGERYIETVPKHGYRFSAQVIEHPSGDKTGPTVVVPTVEPSELSPSLPRPKSKAWFRSRWPVIAGVLLVGIVVSAVLVSRDQPKLTERDTVVLAEFANSTGDAVFDGALRQGLSSQLEQSPYLNLLSEEHIAQTLSLMAQPRDSRLSHGLAREVCQRTGGTAVLEPTIAQFGTRYLLTLEAINCADGESLGSAEAQASDKDHVLDALGKVASKIRSQLGESLASVQKYDAPTESVTTPSLEALKAYSLGYQAFVVRSDYAAAIPLFQRAISLDPNFAMAYARLGTSYFNVYETVNGTAQVRKAFELRARASEREKLYITSHYELLVTGNLEAARKIYELSAQTYPRDIPLNNLGMIYSELGEFDQALAAYQKVLRVSSGTGNRYANLANGYLQLNRLDDAKATAVEARNRNIDSPELHLALYWVAFLERDEPEMTRQSAEVMGRPAGHEDQMLNFEADTALYFGQLVRARVLTRRAIEAARKNQRNEAAALYMAEGALREALAGNSEIAKREAQGALQLSNGRDVEALSAIAIKVAGDSTTANHLAADLEKRFPEDTIVQSNYLRALRTSASRRDSKQMQAAAATLPYELGGNLETVNFVLYPVYMRGAAYLAAGEGTAAVEEFRKILDHPGAARNEPIGALARLQLGRGLALSGEKEKSKIAYQEFFTVWKDADPDIPVLKQAKSEFAKLN